MTNLLLTVANRSWQQVAISSSCDCGNPIAFWIFITIVALVIAIPSLRSLHRKSIQKQNGVLKFKQYDYIQILDPSFLDQSSQRTYREFLQKMSNGWVKFSYTPEKISNGLYPKYRIELRTEWHDSLLGVLTSKQNWNNYFKKINHEE